MNTVNNEQIIEFLKDKRSRIEQASYDLNDGILGDIAKEIEGYIQTLEQPTPTVNKEQDKEIINEWVKNFKGSNYIIDDLKEQDSIEQLANEHSINSNKDVIEAMGNELAEASIEKSKSDFIAGYKAKKVNEELAQKVEELQKENYTNAFDIFSKSTDIDILKAVNEELLEALKELNTDYGHEVRKPFTTYQTNLRNKVADLIQKAEQLKNKLYEI